MGRIKRYRTALSRHHRSKGFGIHSPFAFNFVRFVLREKSPYYCYEYLSDLRQAVIESLRDVKGHKRVISFKNLKMMFRIANYFNPSNILQVGTCYGMTAAALLNVSSASRLWLYEPSLGEYPVVGEVLRPYLDSIESYNSLSLATRDYDKARTGNETSFVVVNSIPQPDVAQELTQYLCGLMNDDCVIVFRNLSRSDAMKQLWTSLKQSMKCGQSFTNEKVGVIVVQKKLNLEHFFLWF